MAVPELRRTSDPRICRRIHAAIQKTVEQKQCPIFERIFRALTVDKFQITRSRVELQLKNAVKDGLITDVSSTPNHGKTKGETKFSYRVPTIENFYKNYEDDGHDWYCWVCHREGEVYMCGKCPRVFHKKCTEITPEDLHDDFVCYCCKDLESTKQYGKKELQELATMLSYTIQRMKSKCEELWYSPSEEKEPSYKLFVYKDTNLSELEACVKRKEFDSLAKFHYEIEWLFHNAVIFFGGDHQMTNLARMVVLDGQNELSQIDICSDCYIKSNKRPTHWFSQPCKTPHRIVYAKLGSDPPWPAKVLRENEERTHYDVRFFGAPYQRAWVSHRSVWDLSEAPASKKRPKALVQAENELKIYQRLLASNKKSPQKNDSSNSESGHTDVEDDDQGNIPPTSLKGDFDDVHSDDHGQEGEENEGDSSQLSEMPVKSVERSHDKEFKSKKSKLSEDVKDRLEKNTKRRRSSKTDESQPRRTSEPLDSQAKETKALRKAKRVKKDSSIDENENEHDPVEDSPDTQLAQQIKMTDDYKIIEKLQERLRALERQFERKKTDLEDVKLELENSRCDYQDERQRTKKLQAELDGLTKDRDVEVERAKSDALSQKQKEIEAAVEEERKRNELEFDARLKEALVEERSSVELRLMEGKDKERTQVEAQVKVQLQRDREEMQRNFERFKQELELKHSRNLEEAVRKVKMESEEMAKRALQENIRRIQLDSERMVSAAKKKSWCSNCTKEAFYHCCWNTNYCSTDCQRVHWVTHRYQCTREMMSTCRSCQQRQNFTPGAFTPQAPQK